MYRPFATNLIQRLATSSPLNRHVTSGSLFVRTLTQSTHHLTNSTATPATKSTTTTSATGSNESTAMPTATGFGPKRVTASRVPTSRRAATGANASSMTATSSISKATPDEVDTAFLNKTSPSYKTFTKKTPTPTYSTANDAALEALTGKPVAPAPPAAATTATPAPSSTSTVKLTPAELKEKFPFAQNLSSQQPSRIIENNPYVHERWFLTEAQAAKPAPEQPQKDIPEVYITSPEHLKEFLKFVQRVPTIAVDTEFNPSFHYRAQLELMQVATPEILGAVDVQLLRSSPEFKELLEEMLTKEWVVHSHRGDLTVIYDIAQNLGLPTLTPRALFDTQVAIGFLSPIGSMPYASMLDDLLDLEIDKSSTLSDWSRRPLTLKQLAYGIQDVKYLLTIKDKLKNLLKTSSASKSAYRSSTHEQPDSADPTVGVRLDWFEEEMAVLLNPKLYEPIDPAVAHTNNLRSRVRPDTPEFNVWAALCEWRERKSKITDQPPATLLTSDQLISITMLAPKTLADLQQVINIKKWFIVEFGQEILEVVANAKPPKVKAVYTPNHMVTNRLRWDLLALFSSLIEAKAKSMGITSFILAPRRDRSDLALISPASIQKAAQWPWNLKCTEPTTPQSSEPTSFLPSLLPSSLMYRFTGLTEESIFDRIIPEELTPVLAATPELTPPPATTDQVESDFFQAERPVTAMSPSIELGLLRVNKILRGWRREMIGNELLEVLEGKRAVAWKWQDSINGEIVAAETTTTTTATTPTTPTTTSTTEATIVAEPAAPASTPKSKKKSVHEVKGEQLLKKQAEAEAKKVEKEAEKAKKAAEKEAEKQKKAAAKSAASKKKTE